MEFKHIAILMTLILVGLLLGSKVWSRREKNREQLNGRYAELLLEYKKSQSDDLRERLELDLKNILEKIFLLHGKDMSQLDAQLKSDLK